MSVSAFLDLSKTFFLNTLLGANQTIYLDFDGNITSGTSWNTSEGLANIITPAFDFDSDTASFSSVELERIQYIWHRVAEDFSPFNVNVTTQAPADINDLIKSGSDDTRWGVRVAIGGSSYDWYGEEAGGVARFGSFNLNSDTPTFVFAKDTFGDEKYTADAISIERNTDLDFYSFVTGTGQISLIVNPFSRGPNLDILAELYNSAGTLIASSNPTDLLSASITTNVVAGNYYLKIDGIGKENPLLTGYTDYGSLGQYFISGTVNFLNIQRRATGQGGFWDTQKWLAGDFNADGKDDLVNVFNDGGGLANIDAHLSNGESFGIQRWATGQGGFWDTQKWLAGDFNADGKDDLVNVFNDGGGLANIDA
ncbi:MAG: hypothetical protein KME55_40150, partial [Nostoc indistinguendum CM1-VF10]|nr:hypothetical protein [Nostoc indistinguendum CM1-VF10]